MASRIRGHDWSRTPLGPSKTWPQSLKTAVEMVLAMPGPATILWGPEHVQLYNDAYVAIAKDRHPGLLGSPAEEGWPDAYERVIKPLLEAVRLGRPTELADYAVALRAPDGRLEERVFDTAFSPVRDESGGVAGALQTLVEVTERKRAEEALRESEERQAFLLGLTDALRTLAEPEEIRLTAARVLGRHLGASRVAYAEDVGDGQHFDVTRNYVAGAAEAAGRYRYADFGADLLSELGAGRMRVQPDIGADGRLGDAEKAALAAVGVGASLNVPLVKNGRLVAFLGVNYPAAHDFRPAEIGLVSEVAERTWAAVERARAEAALRESEAKYRSLFDTMAEGFAVCGVVRDDAGRVVDLTYLELNQAHERQTGVDRRELIGRRLSEVFTKGDVDRWMTIHARVADTGEPVTVEDYAEFTDRWYALSVYRRGEDELSIFFQDITQRKRAEMVLRESEERRAFLLGLSDALRPIADPVAIQETVSRMTAERLDIGRVAYCEVRYEPDVVVVERDWPRRGMPSIAAGRYRIDDFGTFLAEELTAGRPAIVADAATDPRISRADRENWGAFEIRASCALPVMKEGRFVAYLVAQDNRRHDWTDPEIALLREVSERVWATIEHARVEAALRESEGRNAFLVRFSDAVRGLSDPARAAEEACRILTGQLGTERTLWAGIDRARREYATECVFLADGTLAEPSRWPIDARQPFAAEHLAGRSVVYDDIEGDPRIPDPVKAAMAERGMRAGIAVPVVVDGTLRAVFNTSQSAPRRWLPEEVAFVEALAGRAWAEIERTRAEAALRESEERYRTLVENVGDHAIFMLDADGLVTEWTRGAERVKGYSAREVLGRHVSMFYAPEAVEAGDPERELSEAAREGRAEREQWRIKKGGERIWVNEIATAVRDGTGRIVGFAKIARDLTERMRAGEALRESEERHRLVVEGARDYAIFTLDPEGTIASWSPGAEAVFGWRADEAVGRTPGFTFTPEDRKAGVPEEELATARTDGSAPDVRWHARKDGSRAYIEGRTMALRRPDGGLRGFLKIGQDVTERRRAEEALRESEERYRLAADAAGLGRWEFAPGTGELAGDAAFERHHGVPPGSGLGFGGHLGTVHPDDREPVRNKVAEAVEGRDGYEVEYRVPLPDGSTRFVLSRGRFVPGGDANPDRLVGVTLDVTEGRELRSERERAVARELAAHAEAAERERISRELHDRVAHHMGVAHQSLELHAALKEAAPGRAEEKLAIARETARLALDQTRALSAELKRLQQEELEDGLKAALRALAATMSGGTEVDVSVSGDESAVPEPVALQVYLATREAIRNALRHSGGSRVGVALEISDGEVVGLVEDDGRGFDPEAVAKASPSWGVGLRSMRERSEMLGGSTRVESAPGAGTRVEVRVPLDGRRPS